MFILSVQWTNTYHVVMTCKYFSWVCSDIVIVSITKCSMFWFVHSIMLHNPIHRKVSSTRFSLATIRWKGCCSNVKMIKWRYIAQRRISNYTGVCDNVIFRENYVMHRPIMWWPVVLLGIINTYMQYVIYT